MSIGCLGIILIVVVLAVRDCVHQPALHTRPAADAPPPVLSVDPNSNAMVGPCQSGGYAGGSLTGLGASYGAFEAAHPDAGTIGVAARCTPENYVSFIIIELPAPVAETTINQDQSVYLAYLPSDAIYANTINGLMSGERIGCRLRYYRSATLAAVAQVHSQDGQFVVALESVNLGPYEPRHVGKIFIDLTADLGEC